MLSTSDSNVCTSTTGSAPTVYPLCTRWVLSAPDDTCASLATRLALSLPLLLTLNPGLLCSNLPRTPATLPSFGEQVCVSAAPPSLPCAKPNYRFEVAAGDTLVWVRGGPAEPQRGALLL
ncbi:hypothetical protein CLOM_g11129 [Closterium sp. NIES-68]|nr:hypothetical protein CLOM_g9905 [Closterium sp. NIES-68]GJP52005.1 hypothetical protein CLOM_g11129 [Closterium sp. NIES-68]GJP75265.1 hypothetical protein CLOP_g5720 [Closterium sp. NIES-67]